MAGGTVADRQPPRRAITTSITNRFFIGAMGVCMEIAIGGFPEEFNVAMTGWPGAKSRSAGMGSEAGKRTSYRDGRARLKF